MFLLTHLTDLNVQINSHPVVLQSWVERGPLSITTHLQFHDTNNTIWIVSCVKPVRNLGKFVDKCKFYWQNLLHMFILHLTMIHFIFAVLHVLSKTANVCGNIIILCYCILKIQIWVLALRFMHLASAWLLSWHDFCTDTGHLEELFFIVSVFLHNMLIKDYNSSVTPLLHSTNCHLKLSFILPLPFFFLTRTSQCMSKIFLSTDQCYFG